MGIDVWVLRENVAVDGGALSRLSSQTPTQVNAKVSATGKDPMVVTPEILGNHAPPPASGRTSASPLTAPRQVVLETVKTVTPREVSEHLPSKTVTQTQAVADPEFLMCLLDFSRDARELSCLFLLPYSATTLPPAINRFAADIAIACLGAPSEPKRIDLRWPMVKSSHIAQSADDARQVVISKVKNCGRDVLVFGPAALAYCGIASGSTAGAVAAHGKRFWPLAEVDDYCNDNTTQAKISLWHALAAIKAHVE
jgi:hypothetical protein